MMGPRQELATTGVLGLQGADLLYRTVAAVAVARNFPPPPGSGSWDASAVAETAHDMVDGERGRKRLTDALLRSMDEASFARVLEGAAVNYLRDVARRTDLGKVVLRVTELLREHDLFVGVDGRPQRWRLADSPDRPTQTSAQQIARAAGQVVHVVLPSWSSDRRDPPIADRDSLVRILTAVLEAADGAITAVEAAHAVAARIEVRHSPLTVELDTLERVAEPPAMQDPATAAAVGADAALLFERLDDRQRILLANFHLPLDQLAGLLTLRRSQTALLRQRLVARLQRDLGVSTPDQKDTGDLGEAVLTARAVRDLCIQWVEDRTPGRGATSIRTIDEEGRRR